MQPHPSHLPANLTWCLHPPMERTTGSPKPSMSHTERSVCSGTMEPPSWAQSFLPPLPRGDDALGSHIPKHTADGPPGTVPCTPYSLLRKCQQWPTFLELKMWPITNIPGWPQPQPTHRASLTCHPDHVWASVGPGQDDLGAHHPLHCWLITYPQTRVSSVPGSQCQSRWRPASGVTVHVGEAP